MYIPEHYQEYQTAIRAAGRPLDLVEGTIIFTDATTMSIDSSVLLSNAISISKQCVDGDSLMFGGVFTSVLKLSLLTDKDRYAFFNAKIQLGYKITIGYTESEDPNDEHEPIFVPVPLGVFYVADATRTRDTVNLTAYDSMTLLDKEIGDLQISGTPWVVFQQVSLACGYELAFEETDLINFPNYDQSIGCSSDNGIKTYRDVVKVVCQMLGCFALDDRTGRLALKKFSTTPDITLGDNETGDYPWYEYTPADYECSYIGVAITGMQGTYHKITDNPDAFGLILKMEDAPAWDYGVAETQETKTNAIYELLYDDTLGEPVFTYTPGTLDMPSDATYECGDMLQINTPYSDEPYYLLITSITWNFHNGMTIESTGINPFLDGSTPKDEESTRMINQGIAKNKLQFIKVTNNAEKEIGHNESEAIISVVFTPTAQTSALFVATIVVDVSGVADIENSKTEEETVEVPVYAYNAQSEVVPLVDANGNPVDHLTATGTNTFNYKDIRDGKDKISIWYVLDEIIQPSPEEPYYAIDELPNGKHIITISYLIQIPVVKRYFLDVYMKSEGGTVTIPQWAIQAAMLGQEIDEVQRFDGNIRVNDEEPTGLFDLGAIAITALTDAITIATTNALEVTATDMFTLYNIGSISSVPLTDTANVIMEYTGICSEESDDFYTEDGEDKLTVQN